MKKLLILFLLFTSYSLTQGFNTESETDNALTGLSGNNENKIDSARNFFPSELNNMYQTEVFSEGRGPGGGGYTSGTFYSSFGIIADTIIYGKRFVRFIGYYPFNPAYYFHYDQAEQKVFIKIPTDDSVRLAVDFNIPAGDTVISYISGVPLPYVSSGLNNVYLFNDSVMAYHMEYTIFTKKYKYTFADNIGLSNFYVYGVTGVSYWGASTISLFSAIIDTVIYNPIYLTLYTLYPLIDRPVNTFPFVLYGAYQSNLNLVNEFYVEVSLVRGVDTLGTYTYQFNNNAATITIFPHVGDRLLLKGHVHDQSIFNNHDVFPDSGYAEILVLPSTVQVEEETSSGYSFSLAQNYPNPFNPSTLIRYSIPERSFVSLVIYDAMGNEIARPVSEEKQAGSYSYTFDGSGLGSGIYLYNLKTGAASLTKKMILLK